MALSDTDGPTVVRDDDRRYLTPGYVFDPLPETFSERAGRIRADDGCRIRQLRTIAEGPQN